MTKVRSTKKSLAFSILSLVLCFSMLLGTTFAWFTDSVTSANNVITSGKLDVELYYQVEGQTDWTKVTEQTNVFKENALWEPGYTEVVKFKVVNEGNLALKYNLGVNVASEVGSVNVNGNEFLLSDYIKFAVIDGAQNYNRDQAVAAAEETGATALKTPHNSGAKTLLKDEEAVVTMVVYMPESVGNDANAAKDAVTPTIKLGINIVATQATYEQDSFNDQYDKDAVLPELNFATKEENKPANIGTGDVSIQVPADAPAGDYAIKVSNKTETTDAAGKTTVAMDISLTKDGVKVSGDGTTLYTVSVDIGRGYTDVSATHNGNPVTVFVYDPITGIFTFDTADFSPFSFTFKDMPEFVGEGEDQAVVNTFVLASDNGITYFADLQTAIDSANNGDTIVLLDNMNGDFSFTKAGEFTLNLNGFKINATGSDAIAVTGADTVLTVKNGTLESSGNNCGGIYVKNGTAVLENCTLIGTNEKESCGVYASNGSNVTVNNCKLSANHYGITMMSADVVVNNSEINAPVSISSNGSDMYDKSNLTINSGTYNGAIYWPAQGKLTINGGKFTADTAIYVKSGSLEINGGTFIGNGEKVEYKYKDSGSIATGSAIVLENVGEGEYDPIGTVSINGGTFISENNMPIESVTKGVNGVNAKTKFVYGGTFSSEIATELVAIGYELNMDGGDYIVTALAPLYVNSAADLDNAIPGQTIYIQSDITLDTTVTLPANVTLVGNGKQIEGTIYAGGDLTIVGHVKVTTFSASYYNRVITITKGACLEITGTGRVSLAYGNTFNIIGSLEDAKNTDKTQVQPSLIIPGGISITGGSNATMNVTNAYVKIGSTTSKDNSANGTFTLNFENSIVEFTTQFTLAEPTNGMKPTFKINAKDSVITTGTKFVIAAPNSSVVLDNSILKAATYFRNSGELTLKNGTELTAATIQFGENGGNDGTTIVDNSTLTITASSTGHALDGKDTGKIIVKNGATVSVTYYKGIEVLCDETSVFTGTEV